jgi:hypothetical protein
LFRGLALVCILIDHIPGNRASSYTIRNLGFADASEVFVFISAYAAGLVYGGRMLRHGLAAAALRVWQRAGVVYLAHVVLVVITTGLAAWLSSSLADPRYIQGLNVQPLLATPARGLLDTLTLGFQPIFNNILPLYCVLLLAVPAMLWLVSRHVGLALAASALVYVVARAFPGLWFEDASGRPWEFNPLAWQVLFTIGVSLGAARAGASSGPRMTAYPVLGRVVLVCAAGYAVFAFAAVRLGWNLDAGAAGLPDWWSALVFPVLERPGLSVWRLAHVLSLAYLVAWLVPPDARIVVSRLARPLILCGQHSLPLFGGGVLLSVLGWATLASVGDALPVLALVNVTGVGVTLGLAWLLDRRRRTRVTAQI